MRRSLDYLSPLFRRCEAGQEFDTLLIFRVMVETMNLGVLQQLTGVLLSGYFTYFNRDQWRKVVQDSFNQVPMVVTTFAHLQTLQGLIVNTHLKPKFVLGPYKLLVGASRWSCCIRSRGDVVGHGCYPTS